jgi:hypothetical protein
MNAQIAASIPWVDFSRAKTQERSLVDREKKFIYLSSEYLNYNWKWRDIKSAQ